MTKIRSKTFGANFPVPQSRDEAASTVRVIGDLDRQVKRLEADMNDELARIKESYQSRADALKEGIEEKTEGLKMWAEANRLVLTDGEKTKTVDLGTGLIKWRLSSAFGAGIES